MSNNLLDKTIFILFFHIKESLVKNTHLFILFKKLYVLFKSFIIFEKRKQKKYSNFP